MFNRAKRIVRKETKKGYKTGKNAVLKRWNGLNDDRVKIAGIKTLTLPDIDDYCNNLNDDRFNWLERIALRFCKRQFIKGLYSIVVYKEFRDKRYIIDIFPAPPMHPMCGCAPNYRTYSQ